MRATIWISRDNEEFWLSLENKSGWVNMIIEALLEEQAKRLELEKKYNEENDEEAVL
jgi:hypothetical protein